MTITGLSLHGRPWYTTSSFESSTQNESDGENGSTSHRTLPSSRRNVPEEEVSEATPDLESDLFARLMTPKRRDSLDPDASARAATEERIRFTNSISGYANFDFHTLLDTTPKASVMTLGHMVEKLCRYMTSRPDPDTRALIQESRVLGAEIQDVSALYKSIKMEVRGDSI
ncbi:hypothetical protein N7478_001965 [Penicillium angulare]|uniref:uncharacterized protein n=1 Tax=Penicillium angulare TaxID=116970 RepID=UPI0025400E2B|nr:uncharacterized protein N7478_001965 [Penicillium angulare]KAJ5288935.1 hypothetical protein N7478_001965 [Penicillium angulare]